MIMRFRLAHVKPYRYNIEKSGARIRNADAWPTRAFLRNGRPPFNLWIEGASNAHGTEGFGATR